MIRLLLLALTLTGATVAIHAVGTVHVVLPLSGVWGNTVTDRKVREQAIPLIRLVSGLLLLHLLEMTIWAIAFAAVGVLPDFETALYYSFKSYTTVGYGDVLPPTSWRLIGPVEAAVGVLMLGWSTGFIVAAVQQIYHDHRERPRRPRT